MRSFFFGFGGKWRVAAKYPAPRHDTVIEPFAGSAGYSVRHGARRAILVDKDPIIVGIWRYLIKARPEEILRLPDVPPGGSTDDFELCLPQEARWLIGYWLDCASAALPVKRPCKWMREGKRPKSFWGPNIRQRIARQVDQIRDWKVYEGSYEVAPTMFATWFIDPPYQVGAGKRYRYGSAQIDYPALGAWCRSLPGQVIACEGHGADWLPFEQATDRKYDFRHPRRQNLTVELSWTVDERGQGGYYGTQGPA